MPDLPYDIIALIVQFLAVKNWLYRNPVARYSTISRLWNEAIEREVTFKELLVRSSAINSITIARLGRVLQRDGGRRRKYVRHVVFTPESVSRLIGARARTPLQREADDALFSRDVKELWDVLKDWPPELRFRLSISLHGRERAIWPDSNSFVNYVGDPLPLLPNVSEFETGVRVRIWPPSVIQLSQSMPALKSIDITIADVCASRWAAGSNVSDVNQVLATSIGQIPHGCSDVKLYLGHTPHGRAAANDGFLCASIAMLSPQLRSLGLVGAAVTPTVLDAVAAIHWPNMQHAKFDYDAMRVNGKEDTAFINALFVAAAGVVRNMPALLRLDICTSCDLGIEAGRDLYFRQNQNTRKWVVGWHPGGTPFHALDDEVLKAWGVDKPASAIQWKKVENAPEEEPPTLYAEEVLSWRY